MSRGSPKVDLTPTGLLPIETDLWFEITDAPPLDPVRLPLVAEAVTEEPMPQAPKAFVYEPIDFPKWVSWGLVALGMALLAILLGGCSSNREAQAVELVHEARILLGKPYPSAKRWEARRSTFMDDSGRWLQEVAPATSEAR